MHRRHWLWNATRSRNNSTRRDGSEPFLRSVSRTASSAAWAPGTWAMIPSAMPSAGLRSGASSIGIGVTFDMRFSLLRSDSRVRHPCRMRREGGLVGFTSPTWAVRHRQVSVDELRNFGEHVGVPGDAIDVDLHDLHVRHGG